MALVKWSGMIAEVRGKLNGTVFARNRYSCYARNKVTPYNPQSPAQQYIRNIFAQLSKKWRNLTQDERDAWNRAVVEFIKTNIFGDKYKPSGINLFIRINMNLFLIGQPMITLPPVPVAVDYIRIIKIKLDINGNAIDLFIESKNGINHIPTVFVTRPLSPGITYVKSEFRMIEYSIEFLGPDQYILHIGAQYKSKYGPLVDFIGQRFSYKITPIDKKTGLNGISVQDMIIIKQ
jgi:hypothetical protein